VHIVIMGCGRVGSSLAHNLESRGCSVAIIDQNEAAFRRLTPQFRGTLIKGVGFERDVLIEAGIEHADAFAAVSSGDNSNIISARLARETFGVSRVVARIYDSRRAEVYERLGIPTVATVRWTADRMLRALVPDLAHGEIWRDPTSSIAVIQPPLHPQWRTSRVAELEEATGVRVAYVVRFGAALLPTPSLVIQEGDTVFFLATDDVMDQVTEVAAASPRGDA
jgi:trk system potassium uptake protein TrkA